MRKRTNPFLSEPNILSDPIGARPALKQTDSSQFIARDQSSTEGVDRGMFSPSNPVEPNAPLSNRNMYY